MLDVILQYYRSNELSYTCRPGSGWQGSVYICQDRYMESVAMAESTASTEQIRINLDPNVTVEN